MGWGLSAGSLVMRTHNLSELGPTSKVIFGTHKHKILVMKKLLFTAILSAFASHICGQSILIERVLFSTPNEINILSIDRNQGKVYFTSPSRPGLLYTDLRTNKVILDSTLSNLELSGFTKLNPAYSLLQMPDRVSIWHHQWSAFHPIQITLDQKSISRITIEMIRETSIMVS